MPVTKKQSVSQNEVSNDTQTVKEATGMSVEDMLAMIANLTAQVNKLNSQHGGESVMVSKMDRPCTLIHLCECNPMLPSTIRVNGNEIRFTKFGERRTFRFAEMQDITSRYRDWFERGVFTLGEDCDEMVNDFGLDIMDIPMSVEQYAKIATLPLPEYKRIVDGLSHPQALRLAQTWIKRYEANMPGYSNLEKVKILNKKTKGFMKQFMSDLLSDDTE